MEQITIKISDYLTESQTQKIVEEEYRAAVRQWLSTEEDIKRTLSNSAYDIVWRMVDDVFDRDPKKYLKDKIIEVINDLSFFSVFSGPGMHTQGNEAYKVLMEIVDGLRPEIEARAKMLVSEINLEEAGDMLCQLRYAISDSIAAAVTKDAGNDRI